VRVLPEREEITGVRKTDDTLAVLLWHWEDMFQNGNYLK
jgi:hypothetical protein